MSDTSTLTGPRAKRMAQLAPQTSEADATADVYRDPATGRLVAGGRTRKRGSEGNPFHIPPEIVPPNMGYQWVAVSVFNQGQVGHVQHMVNNGWTDVPTERHAGLFLPVGAKGPIEIDGQRLMENRIELINEARSEDKRNADRPVEQVTRAFGIKGGTNFDTDARGARANTFVETRVGPANIPLD